MPDHLTNTGTQYSTGVGLVYVFNLIVGTGALTMPAAFQQAGWAVSMVLVVFLGFTSYLTVTFIIEAMAVANAKIKTVNVQVQASDSTECVSETEPLLRPHPPSLLGDDMFPLKCANFEITERIELGKMAGMFFNRVGQMLFYICMIIYLYGDLAIYGAAVPKSIRNVVCTYRINGSQCNANSSYINVSEPVVTDDDPCWESSSITRLGAYRIFVACFLCLLGPFVFFNVQKTKYLQFFTTLTRWLSFGLMITLAVIQLARGKGKGNPVAANFSGIPNLFGVCVYSFMCHHSLPSLVTPIKNKHNLSRMLMGDFILILAFYALLSFTAIFTFASIQDLYTLNFFNIYSCGEVVTSIKPFEYFLALFPVFTLSTNFPIISITLRNNIQTMVNKGFGVKAWYALHFVIPLIAVLPPIGVAFVTSEVEFLVGITGSYAGAGIQYVIPAFLVYLARKDVLLTYGHNRHRSWFSGIAWVVLVLLWSLICIVFVTVNHIITETKHNSTGT